MNGRIFSVTPSFFGTNPAEVKEGPFKGLKVLAAEEDTARKLARSLSPPQRALGIISDKAPADILTKQDSVVNRKTFFPPKGLPITKMNSRQKGWLGEVVETYAAKHRPEVLAQVTARNPLIDPVKTYFAWAGSRSPGASHYSACRRLSFFSNTTLPKTTPITFTPCGRISTATSAATYWARPRRPHKPELARASSTARPQELGQRGQGGCLCGAGRLHCGQRQGPQPPLLQTRSLLRNLKPK